MFRRVERHEGSLVDIKKGKGEEKARERKRERETEASK